MHVISHHFEGHILQILYLTFNPVGVKGSSKKGDYVNCSLYFQVEENSWPKKKMFYLVGFHILSHTEDCQNIISVFSEVAFVSFHCPIC